MRKEGKSREVRDRLSLKKKNVDFETQTLIGHKATASSPERQAGHTGASFITLARITAQEAGTNFSIRFIMQQGAGILQACSLSLCRTELPSGWLLRRAGETRITNKNFQILDIPESLENIEQASHQAAV